jgi:hypothetical protein
MREKIRMPSDLENVSLKLLGKLDAKDLARLTAPTAILLTATYPPAETVEFAAFLATAIIGAVWVFWKPWNQSIDTSLYHGLRWLTNKRKTANPETENRYLTSNNQVSTLIELQPVNLELKSGTEKAALHKQYQEFLQSIDYPVTVYSTQHPFNLKSRIDETSVDKLWESYHRYCRKLVEEGQFQTRHLIELQAQNEDVLEHRIEEALEKLNSGALTAEQITEPEMLINQDPESNYNYNIQPDQVQRKYSKTLYISGYPRDVDFSWPTSILRIDGIVDATQVIKPREPARTVSQLQKTENKAEAENQSLVRKGYGSSRRLERLLDDVDWFRNLLADQEDQPVEYGVYITAYGETREACRDTFRQVKNRLKTLGINYRDTGLRTDQSHVSTTPGLNDRLNETLLMPAGSAASGFPFSSPLNIDDNGVLFGVDQSTMSPVILDRFKWNAGHQVLAGVTGSGKSFHSKLLLLRSAQVYDDLHINIIDPKPEYGALEESLSEYASVNRFELNASTGNETGKLVEAVEEAYQDAQETKGKTIVVIDEAHRLLKHEEGASILSTLVREARSSNTAVTLITQTISDFYRSKDGQDLLKNIPCKILFAHEKTDDQPAQAFQLSQRTETRLYNLTKGNQDSADHSQAILTVNNKIEAPVKIEATDNETKLIQNTEVTADNPGNQPKQKTGVHGLTTGGSTLSPQGGGESWVREKLSQISTPEAPELRSILPIKEILPDPSGFKLNPFSESRQRQNLLENNRRWSRPNIISSCIRRIERGFFLPIAAGGVYGIGLGIPPITVSILLGNLLELSAEAVLGLYIVLGLLEISLLLWQRSSSQHSLTEVITG